MQHVAITMQDGSVRRMQLVSGTVMEAIAKTPWADRVRSWRLADPEEFPANSTWRDEGGKIVGVPIEAKPDRDALAEIDQIKAFLVL